MNIPQSGQDSDHMGANLFGYGVGEISPRKVSNQQKQNLESQEDTPQTPENLKVLPNPNSSSNKDSHSNQERQENRSTSKNSRMRTTRSQNNLNDMSARRVNARTLLFQNRDQSPEDTARFRQQGKEVAIAQEIKSVSQKRANASGTRSPNVRGNVSPRLNRQQNVTTLNSVTQRNLMNMKLQ